MIGIDATHAWAAVWTPQNQWLGLDPTNDQMVDERYIIVGWGRDYADVPPLRGIIYTDSESSVIDVAVDVAPFEGECCMRDFICPNCGQHLAFENSVCLSCGSPLGFSLDDMALLVISSGDDSDQPGAVDADKYELCANLHVAECNWLVEKTPASRLCVSCALTRTRPNDDDTKAMAEFADAEKAKRRLDRRAVRAEAADRRARRGPGVRAGVRPALQ